MKKILLLTALVAACVTGWLLRPGETESPFTPAKAVSPPSPSTATEAIKPLSETPTGSSEHAVALQTTFETVPISVPMMSPTSAPIPGQVVDADGVVTEEVVDGPTGGKIRKRYTYGNDGRLARSINLDGSNMIEVWDYVYDADGRVSIRVTDSHGNEVKR